MSSLTENLSAAPSARRPSRALKRARQLGQHAALALALGTAGFAPAAVAQTETIKLEGKPGYMPEVGQEGKDVIWVPTPQALVERMLDIAKVTPKDYLIDLGSGDGRTVITAAKRGLTAHGIEYNPDMVALAKAAAQKEGVAKRATFEAADLFESDLSKAQVITMFLLPTINERLRPELLKLEPGTRLVSNSFRMGEWEPDDTTTVGDGCQNWCTAYLWVVPAQVEGNWKINNDTLALKQNFQLLTGTLGDQAIEDARVTGKQITFRAGDVTYTGEVNGTAIKGQTQGSRNGTWSASKG